MFVELGNKNPLFLEVRLFAQHTARIEFGSTNTVGVAATHLRPLFGYRTNFRHINFLCCDMISSIY